MWGVAFGLLLAGAGAVLIAVGSRSLDAAAARRTALLEAAFVASPASPQYEQFTRTGTFGYAMNDPVFASVYLWNLTNAEDVLAGRAVPRVAQIGPYVYEKKTRKVNVTFHSTLPATTQDADNAATLTEDYGYVSYGVVTSYAFDAARSNGSELDRVVTLNATYARQLTKYRALGYSERLVVAQYAQQHMAEYDRHLRREFIAETKQRGLQFFLPQAIETLTRESVRPAILRQREQIDSASIPRNLVQMYAVARTEAIPQVLGDVMNDITDRFLPSVLQSRFDAAKNHALPRVVSNLFNRLKVEAVPVMLRKQIETQYARQVPFTLNSLANKLPQLAFPYVMQELFERACIEAVPFMLRTIKLEIIARDTATNQNQADVAQDNVLEAWRLRSSSDRVDFDAWIDGSPTGVPRTGFELRPPRDDLQLSKEAAALILGSKTSNKRFSIIDYDVQKTATYPLDTPTDTPVGFAMWKQVIAMNETSISYLIDSVNNDVARQSDYITREQVMFVREYLIQWAKSDVVRRDRERFWIQNYVKRTADSDFNEPAVDLDIEKPGTQTGFNLQVSTASSSGVTLTIARQLWTATDPFSFMSTEGFTLWYQAVILQSSSASQALQVGIPGLTSAHLSEVSAWVSKTFGDGFVLRRALRHWADGTCLDSFKLRRPSCLLYDLEPHIPGAQTGFEMNPQSDSAIVVSQALREELWDSSKSSSFLFAVQAAETKTGYGLWLQAIRAADTSDILKLLSTNHPTFTTSGATGITRWIRQLFTNDLHTLNILNWWRTGTCWPREKLSETAPTPMITSALSSCTPAYKETEQSAQELAAGDPQSPFSTTQRVLRIDEVKCDLDSMSSKYTKTESSYQLTVKEYSCEAFSTELSDDHAVLDFKTGFELAPLITLANAGLRPSLAVASALWDPSNTFSFLHPDGYKQWVFDFVGNPAAVRTSLTNSINARVPAVCSKLSAGGVRSAIFNVTLVGTEGYCDLTTANQIDTIQTWVSSVSGSSWMESALLDQWRRGELASGIDIEPYRPEKQVGWELSRGCECSLTSIQGTKYEVPRAALALWQAKTHPATFLTTNGYKLWSDVIDVLGTDDASTITSRKQQIVTACSLSAWEPWLDRVVAWLKALKANEHLVRDVLGHWIHGTCPTPSSLDVISVVSEGSPTTSVQASCPPGNDRYKVTLNVPLDDILLAASRPTFSHYFDPKIVEKSALIQPSKVVEETETIIGCEYKAANQVTVSTQTRVRKKKYLSCNFLSVLSDGTTASVPIVERETHFEMNRTSEGSHVSMEVAQAAWLNSSTTEWAFTNVDVFLNKWQRAIDRAEELSALQVAINGAVVSAVPTALQDVVQYLKMWETSSDSVREIGKVWLRSSIPFYDLDPSLEGSQGGFELFSSAGWRKVFDMSTASLPSLGQAQYLWDANNEYSFLNREAQLSSNGFPIGFNAWREIYDGVDFSSERLVDKYPEVATVERDNAVHRLSGSDRTALLALMASATSLTNDQIRAIASWLMAWSENNVLRDYILETWATGRTPRGEEGATIDMSLYIAARFKLNYMPSSATAVDKMTTNAGASVLKSIPKLIRRKLWDVSAKGSLLSPVSRDVWCLLDVPKVGVCAHVLDDLGFLNTTSFSAFVEVVQPIVQDLQTISRSSNFTSLALKYFERQYGLSEDQTTVIVMWWRSLPTKSAYFQALQAQRWQLPADGLVSQRADPLWFGFGLVDVFPTTEGRISRRATSDDLVSNGVDVTPAKCRISLELVIVLWRSNAPSSFLHSTAWKTWLDYAEQTTPRGTTTFLKSLSDSDATVKAITSRLASASASCTVEAIANWLLSWESHPYTRLFVERLWYHVSTSPVSPIAKVIDPSALMLAMPVDRGVSFAPRPELVLRVHARLAELMFDSNESVALTNLTTGFPLWRALLTECTSTNVTSFKCEPFSDAEAKRTAVSSAVDVLSLKFVDRMQSIDPGLSVTKENVAQAIRTVVVPWLLYWLDHSLLLRFILQDAARVDASLIGHKGTLAYNDFPAIQFTSSTFSRVAYDLPRDGPDETTYFEHEGVASERITRLRLGFDTGNGTILQQTIEGLAGFGELAAFCSWNKFDRVYAHDATKSCSLGTTYDVPIPEAKAILATLSDPTEWASANGKLSTKRAALLIDAFLAQPFASPQACILTMENLALAYELSSDIEQRACKITANGVLLDLPLLSDMGLTSSLARIKDLQAYLKYAATKFVYEPSVLGILAPVLQSANLTQPRPTLETWTEYPIGGYVAAQTVARVASPASLTTSLWQTADVNVSNPQFNTYLVPTRNDPQLLTKNRERVLGELVVLNGSTKAVILGASFRLSLGHFTDGSQFATAIRLGHHDPIFPPPQLRFYWEYARRIVVLSYVRNVTRFGIPLMRYTIDNWREPSNLPSGLDAAVIGDKDAPSGSVNVSALFSDLTLVLSSAPSTPSTGPLEQTRETAVDIDPVTGVVYHRRLSWQLTARISGADAANDLWHRQVSNGWLPVTWLREQHSVSPSSALEFVANTAKPGPFAPEKLAMWGVVGGCAYVVVGLAISVVYAKRARVMRIRKQQSVMPAGLPNGSSPVKQDPSTGGTTSTASTSATDVLRASVDKQVAETSDVNFSASGLITVHSSPWARKRTVSRVQTIAEDREDAPDVQQV